MLCTFFNHVWYDNVIPFIVPGVIGGGGVVGLRGRKYHLGVKVDCIEV